MSWRWRRRPIPSPSACATWRTRAPAPSSTMLSAPTATVAAPEWVKLEFEPDAYYTSLGLYLALTTDPIPHVGEKSEE